MTMALSLCAAIGASPSRNVSCVVVYVTLVLGRSKGEARAKIEEIRSDRGSQSASRSTTAGEGLFGLACTCSFFFLTWSHET